MSSERDVGANVTHYFSRRIAPGITSVSETELPASEIASTDGVDPR